MNDKFDKLQRPEFHKQQVFAVSIAWSGTPPSVDRVIGVYEDTGVAMNVSDDRQVHVTQAMLATPGIVVADGRVFVAADDAGAFSVFVDEASARRHAAVSGGRMKSFVLNAGNVKAAGSAGMEKAAFDAIKSALAKPLSSARAMWR
jgi:hypothetical protein